MLIEYAFPEEYEEDIPYPNANLSADEVEWRIDVDETMISRNEAMDEMIGEFFDNLKNAKNGEPFGHHVVAVWVTMNEKGMRFMSHSRMVDENAPQEVIEKIGIGNRIYILSINMDPSFVDGILGYSGTEIASRL